MHQNLLKLGMLDSQPLVLKGLKSLFEGYADIKVTGVFEDSYELFDAMPADPLDVLLMEYVLDTSDLNGAELIRCLRQQYPQTRILVFSATQDPAIVALAMRLGAHGYINKRAHEEDIIRALRRVHDDGRYIDPDMRDQLPDSLAPITPHEARGNLSEPRIQALLRTAELSPCEYAVLRKFVAGANVMEIAERLHKSPKTISSQKAAAFRKLGVSTDNGLYRLVGTAADPALSASAFL